YLLADAAKALQKVELGLRQQGMRLRLFDCYRPARAVRNFVAWAGDLDDQRTKPEYYPRLDKRQLLGDYISPTSGHSRGATLDLT
ncbi:M15 family metallopeptidase, partial [Variovorax sp. 2RAF20]